MHMPSADRAAPRGLALTGGQQSVILIGLLVVGLIVRVAYSLAAPGFHFPDENFQLFEIGHKLAFGYGLVTWEFFEGVRSPVLPYLLGGVFAVAEPIVGGPQGYLIVARTLLALTSLIAVVAVFRMGMRESPLHGVIAGFVAATWYEIVYFAGRPLTEALATTFLITALALASALKEPPSRRRLFVIGVCLALAGLLRIHLAPGLLVAAIFIAGGDIRRWMWLMLGGLVPAAIFGIADWVYWGLPFQSYWRAFAVNILQSKASEFGTSPPAAYISMLLLVIWPGVAAIFAALWFHRGKASMMWIAVAAVIILVHSLIPHKEYRFIVPATACLVIVAALGSASLLRNLGNWLRPSFDYERGTMVLCAIWLVTSASLGASAGFRSIQIDDAPLRAQFALNRDSDLCGLLFYDWHWSLTGGYTYLHRNVPIYVANADEDPRQLSGAANAIVARRSARKNLSPEFTPGQCFAPSGAEQSEFCIFKRSGSCARTPAADVFEFQRRLRDSGA